MQPVEDETLKRTIFGVASDISKIKFSEEKFAKLFQINPSACCLIDPDNHKYLEVNEAFCSLLGFSNHELIGKTALDLGVVTPEIIHAVSQKADTNGKVTNVETELKTKNGGIKHVLFSAENIYLQDKKYCFTVVNDITDRKQVEEALIESEKRLNLALSVAKMAYWRFEIATNKVEWSEGHQVLFGISMEEFAETLDDVQNHVHEEDREYGEKNLERTIKENVPFDNTYRVIYPNGDIHWLHSFGYLFNNAQGAPDHVFGVTQDITDQKSTENELRKLSRAVEQSPASILITEPDGKIVYGNPKVCELTGYPIEELLGQNPRIMQSGETPRETYKILWDAILSGNEYRNEFINKKKNGELYWESVSISPIVDSRGKIINFLAVKEDINERKKMIASLQEALVKAESADLLKKAFIQNISHEIRTPMNSILGFGQLTSDPDLTQYERERYFTIVKASANRLMNTVTDFMDISLIISGNLEIQKKYFSFGDLLDLLYVTTDKFMPSSKAQNIGLTLQTPPITTKLNIYSDYELLRKVLSHLLYNAFKFTKQGTVSVGFEVKGNELEFFVKDTGVGINKELQAIIFDKFMQENPLDTRGHEGSGLGLSIAKGIVELMGGNIWLESVKGEGSTFFFTIPVYLVGDEKQVQKETAVSPTAKPLILIADDELYAGFLLERIFHKNGIDVIVVENGQQAIDACRQNHTISLVMMDLKMPVINGFEATKQIKSFRPELPVIALTAFALSGDENRALENGCDDYISKPFEQEAMLNKLKKYGIYTES
ncbi:MAG: PAS domain S-box protein [Bacteroidetes bacterium]|nr:PAS domain S-box protein [Bacteroidota bacterium]